MAIKTIPLSRLETDLAKTLNECAESGQTLVVEMPDQRPQVSVVLDHRAATTSLPDVAHAGMPPLHPSHAFAVIFR